MFSEEPNEPAGQAGGIGESVVTKNVRAAVRLVNLIGIVVAISGSIAVNVSLANEQYRLVQIVALIGASLTSVVALVFLTLERTFLNYVAFVISTASVLYIGIDAVLRWCR